MLWQGALRKAHALSIAIEMAQMGKYNTIRPSPIQLPSQQRIIFINPTSTCTTILSSIPLPCSLCFYHQSCFHLQHDETTVGYKYICKAPLVEDYSEAFSA